MNKYVEGSWNEYMEKVREVGLSAETQLPTAHTSSAPAGMTSVLVEDVEESEEK